MVAQTIEQTNEIARAFASQLSQNDVVLMDGEMGAGKTAFVRAVAGYFGCEDQVSSPTFAIMNIYRGDMALYHFDMYRLNSTDEAHEAGLFDFIGMDGITLIEWPQNIGDLANATHRVTIAKDDKQGENYRTILIEKMDG